MRRQHGYTLIEMLFVIGFCFLLLLLHLERILIHSSQFVECIC